MTTNTDLHGAMPELPKPIYCAKLARQCTDGCKPEPGRLGDPCWRVDWRDLGNVPATYQVRAAIQQAAAPEWLQQAVLDLNAAWNQKEPEEAIAGHMDLCRRLAIAAMQPKQQPVHLGRGEGGGVQVEAVTDESGTDYRVKAYIGGARLFGDWTQSEAKAEKHAHAVKQVCNSLNGSEHKGWLDEFGNVFPLGAYTVTGKPNWADADKRKWKPLYAQQDAKP